ncbi:MAG TPA: nucleoside hydrolase [Anaerolineae bacterium]|nr:nucleoside hydrolase [Anaerolineae bacterium]
MPSKVLLDTDIGSDIDDAVCLAYLLAQPDCELLGITTVTGEAEKRAMLASALCRVAGKKVPILPGAEKPLLVPQRQTHAPQARALQRWDHDKRFPRGQAVEFLRQTIRAHPGEVTLLTIGPLTNVALLFAVDPEIPALLKGLVMMCGMFTNRLSGVEPTMWNAILDPHATAMVYKRPVAVHRSVGVEVSCQVQMDREQVEDEFHAQLLRPVLDFAGIHFEDTDVITFHDPLAALTLFDDGVCAFEKGTVEMELPSERTRGMTHWTPGGPEAWHEVALDVDVDRFFERFFEVFR